MPDPKKLFDGKFVKDDKRKEAKEAEMADGTTEKKKVKEVERQAKKRGDQEHARNHFMDNNEAIPDLTTSGELLQRVGSTMTGIKSAENHLAWQVHGKKVEISEKLKVAAAQKKKEAEEEEEEEQEEMREDEEDELEPVEDEGEDQEMREDQELEPVEDAGEDQEEMGEDEELEPVEEAGEEQKGEKKEDDEKEEWFDAEGGEDELKEEDDDEKEEHQ